VLISINISIRTTNDNAIDQLIRPDFRSPGGMYETLRPELITATEKQRQLMEINPTSVVSTEMFFQTAFPYLEVRRPFILGVRDKIWKPTKLTILLDSYMITLAN